MQDRVQILHRRVLLDHDQEHHRLQVVHVSVGAVARQRRAAQLHAHVAADGRHVGADGLVAELHVFHRADIRKQHRLESRSKGRLGPERLAALVGLDHQRQVAALPGARHVVQQLHVEGAVLGAVFAVVVQAGVADDFRQVRVA